MITFNARRLPQVRISQDVFGEPLEVSTGGSEIPGALELSNIPPGHYSVTVIQPGQSDATGSTQELDLTSDTELPTGVGVSSSNVSGVVISDADPKDLIVMRLFAKDHLRSFGTRIAEGKFRIELPVPPGTYEVGIGGTSGEQYIKSLVATGAKVKGRSIQIVAGQPVQLTLTIARGMTQIDGLASKDGKSIAGAMILLVPNDLESDSLLTRRDQSDSDGTVTLRQVVPGKYKVLAIQDGWKISWADPKTIQPYLKNATEVNVTGTITMNVKVEVQSVK